MGATDLTAITTDLIEARATFLAYIRRRIADPELAEDILQDSLLRAVQAAQMRDGDRLMPWFYRILQHAIVDAYRRRDVAQRHVIVAEAEVAESGDEIEIDDAILCACVRDLIPTLKPEYADLVRALDLEGETPEAAARRLGLTPTNLKVRRHRARQALRQRLEQMCGACTEHHCLDCSCTRTAIGDRSPTR